MAKRIETSAATQLAKDLENGKPGAAAKAAKVLRALVAERDVLRLMDAEAATHVESVICMRTDFTGDPPYVGWKGLGLALTEALDVRDRLLAAQAAADAGTDGEAKPAIS